MRNESSSPRNGARIVLPLVALAVTRCAMAAGVETGVGVRLAAGYDSNPRLVTQDGPSGAFAQLNFDAKLDVKPTPAITYFLRSEGWGRSHESSAQDADTWGGEVRTGLSMPRLGTQARPASLAIGARLSTRRETFLDRSTGEVYRLSLSSTPPSSVPIPDRFDSESTGAFLNGRLRLSPRLLLSFDGRMDFVDYSNQYDDIPSLGSIDYRSISLEPGVYLKLKDSVSAGVSIVFSNLDYDQQPALALDGSAVAGTLRAYSSREYRFVLDVAPSAGWGIRAGHRLADREDSYAGYYSYAATTTFLTVDRRIGAKNRVEVQAAHSKLDYANAIVPGSTDGSIQGSELLAVSARFDRALGTSSLRWFSEVGRHRVDSHDPVYAYDREWALTGIEFRR